MVSFSCHCLERKKAIEHRLWEVWERNCNYSHFERPKGCWHPSDYSLVYCKVCKALGRTKAKYVDLLPDRETDS